MNWISIALQALKILPEIMTVVEKAFDGIPDSGADKKQMVKTVVQSVVTAVTGVSTGGQADTWKMIERIIDPAIDIVCSFLFPNEKKVR